MVTPPLRFCIDYGTSIPENSYYSSGIMYRTITKVI